MSININIQNSRGFNVNTYSISASSSDSSVNTLSPNVFINDNNNISLSNSIKSLLDKLNKKHDSSHVIASPTPNPQPAYIVASEESILPPPTPNPTINIPRTTCII